MTDYVPVLFDICRFVWFLEINVSKISIEVSQKKLFRKFKFEVSAQLLLLFEKFVIVILKFFKELRYKKVSQNLKLQTLSLGAVKVHSKDADLISNICGLCVFKVRSTIDALHASLTYLSFV